MTPDDAVILTELLLEYTWCDNVPCLHMNCAKRFEIISGHTLKSDGGTIDRQQREITCIWAC